ncbi:MSHA biogenesis protein MshI [Pseudoalteromonas sp. SSDWG2]|uniref:MSHA biogenesis protein MshI n=1 Tax=Pseudoalteromonas sp. SSDWG2 TaxID=3139391 RepID=UPI003BA9E2B1
MGFSRLARIPWLNSNKKTETMIGVSLCTETLLIIVLKKKNQQWYVSDSAQEPVTDLANAAQQIANLIQSVTSSPSQVYLLLPQSYYQIVQVDKPALEGEELIQSLPWTLKDVVTLSAERIVADYIDYPIQTANQQAKVNVFVADKQMLQPLIQTFDTPTMQLKQITAKETAIAQMTAQDNYARMVIFQEPGQEPCVLIIREQQLLLNRRLRGFTLLENDPDELTVNNLSDAMGLEIQRSMDFYESQLKLPPIKEVLFLSHFSSQAVIERMKQLQSVPIKEFKPVMDLADTVAPKFYVALAGVYFAMLETA